MLEGTAVSTYSDLLQNKAGEAQPDISALSPAPSDCTAFRKLSSLINSLQVKDPLLYCIPR